MNIRSRMTAATPRSRIPPRVMCVLTAGVLLVGLLQQPTSIAAPTKDPTTAGDHEIGLTVDGLSRRYIVHVPSSYDGTKPVPVVLMYHGYGGRAQGAMRDTRLPEKSESAGFLAVFPEGNAPDPGKPGSFFGNRQSWNDGTGRFHAGKKNIDDVAFTERLLDDLAARYKVDARRIYVTGFSNGSSMAYRIGAELSHRIAAIAPIASSGYRLDDLKLSRPVPLISIHGVSDPLNPLAGGLVVVKGTRDRKPPPRASIDRWAAACGCPAQPSTSHDEQGIRTIHFGPCGDGAEVVFHVVSALGHQWPGGEPSAFSDRDIGPYTDKINATDVIWEFFQKHALAEKTPGAQDPELPTK